MVTLHELEAAVVDVAKQDDTNDETLAKRVEVAVAKLLGYVPAGATSPRDTTEFKTASNSVKVALRSVYLERQRYKGRDRSEPVNMAMVKAVMNMTAEDREKLPKDAPERAAWDAMLAYCRNIWRDIADIAFPKADDASAKPGKGKKTPTPDTILANLDAFLASNPAPMLVANLFDQIAKRRPAK